MRQCIKGLKHYEVLYDMMTLHIYSGMYLVNFWHLLYWREYREYMYLINSLSLFNICFVFLETRFYCLLVLSRLALTLTVILLPLRGSHSSLCHFSFVEVQLVHKHRKIVSSRGWSSQTLYLLCSIYLTPWAFA